MQCNAMQCNAMQYNTIQYKTIHYITILMLCNNTYIALIRLSTKHLNTSGPSSSKKYLKSYQFRSNYLDLRRVSSLNFIDHSQSLSEIIVTRSKSFAIIGNFCILYRHVYLITYSLMIAVGWVVGLSSLKSDTMFSVHQFRTLKKEKACVLD